MKKEQMKRAVILLTTVVSVSKSHERLPPSSSSTITIKISRSELFFLKDSSTDKAAKLTIQRFIQDLFGKSMTL